MFPSVQGISMPHLGQTTADTRLSTRMESVISPKSYPHTWHRFLCSSPTLGATIDSRHFPHFGQKRKLMNVLFSLNLHCDTYTHCVLGYYHLPMKRKQRYSTRSPLSFTRAGHQINLQKYLRYRRRRGPVRSRMSSSTRPRDGDACRGRYCTLTAPLASAPRTR